MPGKTEKVKVNPTLQEILDRDIEVHNHLIDLAKLIPPRDGERNDTYVLACILADGLSALHDRLGEMWRWDKAVDPS